MNYKINADIKSNSAQIFNAILNNLNDWWGKTDGELKNVGDEFTTTFGKAFWKFKIIDLVENKKISWKCIDGEPEFNSEWIGSELHWTILESEHLSTIRMEHVGLTPKLDCYDICSITWDKFIGESLKNFIETGVGNPHD